jgi:hypothetical protein
MTHLQRYHELADKIKARYPKSEIKYKDENWFWRRMPQKLQASGTTTSPNTIWMPSRQTSSFEMLSHEYQHLVDWNELGTFNFLWMYLCPQVLSVFLFFFMILACGFGLKIFVIITGILGVLFLLPWPSNGRAYLEMKGYLMSMYVAAEDGLDMYIFRKFVVDALRSWLYYNMVWTRTHADNLVLDAEEVLSDKEAIANTSVAFQDVHEILTD